MDLDGNLSKPFRAIRELTMGFFKAVPMDSNQSTNKYVVIDKNGNIQLDYSFSTFGRRGNLLSLQKDYGEKKIVLIDGDTITEKGVDAMLTKETMNYIANDTSLYHINHGRLNGDSNLFWVELLGKYNILSREENRILFPNMWFDAINPFYGEDYNSYLVFRNNKCNLLKSDFNFLKPNGWFNDFDQKDDKLLFYDDGHTYVTDYNGNILTRRTLDLSIENINTRLANGEKPENIFDELKNIDGGVDYPMVSIGYNNYNILSRKDNQLLGDRWYNLIRFGETPSFLSNVVNDRYLFTVHVLGNDGKYLINYLRHDGSYVFTDFWIRSTRCYGNYTLLKKENGKFIILKYDGYLFHQGFEFDDIRYYDDYTANATINNVDYVLSIDMDKMAKFDDVKAYLESNNMSYGNYREILNVIGEGKKHSFKKVYINESFINRIIKGEA